MNMNYFLFGTNNIEKAMAFYDAFFEGTDVQKIQAEGRVRLWASEQFMFGVAEPFDGNLASNGNGTMLGFNLSSDEELDALYQKALDLGGVSEGEPGIRSGRYAAYVRDLDANKICLYV